MIKNSTKALFICNILLLLIIIIFTFFTFKSQSETVYVDNVKLFNDFNMTKELKLLGEKEFNSKKASLDSLYVRLQSTEIPSLQKKY